MTVLFVGPLLTSIIAAGYMAFVSDAHVSWRIIVVILVLVAAALQVIDFFMMIADIHFLIPLLIQIIVTIGVFFWGTWEQSDL